MMKIVNFIYKIYFCLFDLMLYKLYCCIVFIYSSKIIIDTSFIVCYIIYNFIMTGDHPI